MGDQADRVRGHIGQRSGYKDQRSETEDNEDQGYEQWEEGYLEGDDGSIGEAYFLDPDVDFDENDLLFAENVFEPHMMGSPVLKDGAQPPDVPGWELEDDSATSDPYEALESGLVYYPPEDPPTLPSPSLRDADVASGFASSADEASLDELDTPERFEFSDLDVAGRAAEALRLHAETSDLSIRVQVVDGIATLRGEVRTLEEINMVEDIVSEVEGVEAIREQLTVVEPGPRRR